MALFVGVLSVLFIMFLASCLWYIYMYKYEKHLKHIPGPKRWPIIGSTIAFYSPKHILNMMMSYEKTYGPILKVPIGLRLFFIVSDYKMAEFILNSPQILHKSVDYLFIRPWLGTGLFTSDPGAEYKIHRKVISPAFSFNEFKEAINVFEKEGDVMIDKLNSEGGKTSVDIYLRSNLCALDIICEMAMGVAINAQTQNNTEYMKCIHEICRIVVDRSMSPLKTSDFLFKFSKDHHKQQNVLAILHGYTDRVINEKIMIKNRRNEATTEKRKDFLDILIEFCEAGHLTRKSLRDEVTSFLFGGHDTIASALSFILYCIANNPDSQEEAFKEQLELFGGVKNPKITREDLQEMHYLEMVVKESLRLYPPAPFFLRDTQCEIQYEDLTIPKGVTLTIFPFALHRSPKYFNDPLKFDPDRFKGGKQPYGFLPFSLGPRNCLGQKFAMLELKSIVSKVIRHFELVPAVPEHKLHLMAELGLKSENGVRIGLSNRP